MRVNATLGFGRSHIAPLISSFAERHPQVQVQLQLTVNPPPLTEDAFDVCVRFGEPPDARVIARHIAAQPPPVVRVPRLTLRATASRNRAQDLARHHCIGIRQGDEAYGVWRLTTAKRTTLVKVRGPLSTNDGEIAVGWALAGHGVVLRAEWDIARYLRSGRLVQVLAQCEAPSADIYAVYAQRHQVSARVRSFVDHVAAHFGKSATRAAGLVRDW